MPISRKRAAIYARYSTDMQNPNSVRDQIELCKRLAKREGWHVVEEYSDHAISGTSNRRDGYRRLLDDLDRGHFDVVIAESLDRISRDQEDTAHFYKRTRHRRVSIHTVDRGEVDAIQVGFSGIMGTVFLEALAEKTHRGLSGRIADGKSAGGRSYGYRVALGEHGQPRVGDLEIVEEQAAVVRRIFREYASGRSPLHIATALNDDGIPAPRHKPGTSGHWKQNTINGSRKRGTGILNNELYIGQRVWNRQQYGKDPLTRKRVSRMRDPSEQERFPVPHLRILDDALWGAVKDRQAVMSKQRLRKHDTDRNGLSASQALRRRKYLLSGLLECGLCGGKLTIAGSGRRKRYYCSNSKEKGRAVCTGMPGLLQEDAEEVILGGLREELMKEAAYEKFRQDFVAHLESAARELGDDLRMRDHMIREKEKEQANYMRAVELGAMNASLIEKLNTVGEQIEKLRADREALMPRPIELPTDLPAFYHQHVDDIVRTLSGEEVAGRAGDELRRLIERVVVRHDAELGHTVEIEGELAAMLGAADRKNAASYEAAACSLKLVAGVGFEPTTFRL
ncbi:MAG: recombinase family protein [Parvularcula sp.]|nr:recombinase family protein [Parvularcula sp.]